MTRALRNLALLLALTSCASPPDGVDAPVSDAGGADTPSLGDVPVVDAPPIDAMVAVPTVQCAAGAGPYLIITRDDALFTASSALLRLPIQVTGAASGLAILEVTETIDGAAVRSWDVSTLRGPAGFDGTVTPRAGVPNPTVLFTAVTAAAAAELTECDGEPWARSMGAIAVRLTSNETGELTVTCALGTDFAGRGPEGLNLACARGVPGWLGPDPALSGITSPPFRLMESAVLAHNSGAAPVDAFVATEAMLRSTARPFPSEMACADPTEWTATTGTHQLWRGTSSDMTWSGPVAAGAEESARWLWQEPGALPAGFCFRVMGLPGECIRPTISLTLRGTSSAGAWEWESDLFDCQLL